MAFQVGSACYDTAVAANAAAASSQVGLHLEQGGAVVVVDVAGVTETTITYSYTQVGGTSATQTFAATPQICALMGVDEAVLMGSGLWAALFGAFALMFVTRGLRDHGDS